MVQTTARFTAWGSVGKFLRDRLNPRSRGRSAAAGGTPRFPEPSDSDGRWRALAEATSHALLVVRESDGRILYANPAARSWLALGDDPTGRPVAGLLPAAAAPTASSDAPFQAPVHRADGTQFPALISHSPLAFGGERAWLTSLVDLSASQAGRPTEGEPATREFRFPHGITLDANEPGATRRLLEIVIDAIPMWVFVKDTESRYVLVNRAMADFFGVPREAFMGMHTADMPLPPEAVEKFLESDHWVFDSRRTLDMRRLVLSAGDGRSVPFHSVKSPLFDDEGNLIGLLGVNRDLSDLERAHDEAETGRRLLQTVFDTIPYGLFLKDDQGRFRMVNRALANRWNLKPEDLVGLSMAFEDKAPAKQRDLILGTDRQVLETGKPIHFDRTRTFPDGTDHVLATIKTPVHNRSGAVVGIVGVVEDVTERRRSENLLETILQNLPLVLWSADPQGWVTFAAGRGLALQGLSPKAVMGQSFFDLYADYPEFLAVLRRALAGEPCISVSETRGHVFERWMQPVQDAEGRPGGVIGVSLDVTDRHRSQQELSETRELVQYVVSHSPLIVYGLDASGRITLMEGQGLERVNATAGEMVGRLFAEVLPNQQAFVQAHLKALNEGRALNMNARMAGRLWEIYFAPRFDSGGRLVGSFGVAMDVTDRAEVVRRLRQSEAKFRGLAENSLQGLMVLRGPDVVFANEAALRMFGYDSLDAVRALPDRFMMIAPHERDRIREYHHQRMAGDSPPQNFETVAQRSDGSELPLECQASVVDWEGERAVLLAMMDISERKASETGRLATIAELERLRAELEERVNVRTQELQAAQAELVTKERLATLGLLTGVVSHELRNPLGTIRAGFFLVEEVAREAGLSLEADLARIDRNIDRCDRIIEELLAYTRPPNDQPEPVEMDELTREVLEEAVPPGTGVEVRLLLQGPATLYVDRERLRRAVINIVQNAVQAITDQAGRATGTVRVETLVTERRYKVRITDDGPGVAEADRERLFEPLFSTKGFGVGLGLPIVKQIMESYRGGVEVESDGRSGTTVTLWLPLDRAPVAPAQELMGGPRREMD